MARAMAEFVGGPDCGREKALALGGDNLPPERLISTDGRRQYKHTSGHRTKRDRYRYDWQPADTGRRRPSCEKHNPLQPGCPGYQSKASAP